MKIIEAASFPLDDIIVEDRLREVNPDHVAVIASTVAATGLQHPILLRKRGNELVLVTGAHRLAAFKLLGRPDIPAHVVDAEGVEADYFRELEIVENVARNDLSALDRAIHLGEMLALAEAKGFQRSKGGPKPKIPTGKTFPGFEEAAEKLQVSRRSVNQYLALYKDLAPAVREKLKGTALADNFSELRKLAAEKPEDQIAILDLMDVEEGEDAPANVAQAAALHHNKVDTTTPDEKHFAAFVKLWSKMSKKVKKQAASYIAKEQGV